VYAVILAGGTGKRFWPASTLEKPKQLLDITGEGSMIALTWKRLRALVPAERILVMTGAGQSEGVRGELPELGKENLLSEPVQRNTAPALAVASVIVQSRGDDEPILCCPSDHLVTDPGGFREAVRTAEAAASEGDILVTFGVEPASPATGYGYIEASGGAGENSPHGTRRVKSFHEKPDRERARTYVESGRHYWNSGMFMWRPSVFIEAWESFIPKGRELLGGYRDAAAQGRLEAYVGEHYGSMPSISVDYGIMEKASNVAVVPASFGWSDVGSWDALFEIFRPDARGNVSAGDTVLLDSSGNLLYNPGGLIAAVGVEDLIVAVRGDRVLVCRRGDSQRVREILEILEEDGRQEHL
jgi:mannose-1-phosphate guanylyltransferase